MNLATGQRYARDITAWLAPNCERITVTGSIRRERPEPADVDLCIIPKLTIYRDMFGVPTGQQNHVWHALVNYVNNFEPGKLKPGQQRPKILTGGDQAGHRMTVQLPGCQLDLWFADAASFATKQLHSTGSKEHNIWVVHRAADRGLHWFVFRGLARIDDLTKAGIKADDHNAGRRAQDAGLILPAKDESAFYKHLGLEWIEPKEREIAWLTRNVDSGIV